MATTLESSQSVDDGLTELWFTRCPVPTATGIAYKLGWPTDAFAEDGITLRTLQGSGSELDRHHYDLPTLIREGGNMLSIGAREHHRTQSLA